MVMEEDSHDEQTKEQLRRAGFKVGQHKANGKKLEQRLDEGAAKLVEKVAAEMKPSLGVEQVQELIRSECHLLRDLLLEKNAGYGNSALDPVRVFSKASAVEQIKVRIDDKLSRLKRGDLSKVSAETMQETVRDLQGYLVLLQVAWRLGLR